MIIKNRQKYMYVNFTLGLLEKVKHFFIAQDSDPDDLKILIRIRKKLARSETLVETTQHLSDSSSYRIFLSKHRLLNSKIQKP
jgi:hypothetical protein